MVSICTRLPAEAIRRPLIRFGALALCGVVLLMSSGCAVPQPRGKGALTRPVEPRTQRPYYLYLPEAYVKADEATRRSERWPLVVTFHGMKPFDVAHSQACEWQQEADRYGYIVVAPVLRAFGLFNEFPVRTVNKAFKSDVDAILAILDHVFDTTEADPNNVLSTSWSSGGYMAHYMINQYPERFTCLGVRQSNFSSSVLDPSKTDRSRYHPILILSTQNDFAICKRESKEAIQWYEKHGYKNLAWVYMNRLGHERTPDIAADFFARVSGVKPNRPPAVLVKRQAIDGNPTGLELLAGNMRDIERPPSRRTSRGNSDASGQETTNRRPTMIANNAPEPQPAKRPSQQPPRRTRRAAKPRQELPPPVSIRVSSAIGFEPLMLVYAADCPADWHDSADFHWTLNGQRIGRGMNGQRTISDAGDYTLGLYVVTKEGAEHHVSRRIRVLRNVETSSQSVPVATY